jgi:hypothetical protein
LSAAGIDNERIFQSLKPARITQSPIEGPQTAMDAM